ncbi:hypothetical protein THYS13_07450 [Thermoanaerobacter sp. YS13]|uniref:hypothetical protein n=1 Tax=Thermoanaerobacter sp. YS13 TaxID=1511746 RepID=UPI000574BD1B|nr:hypothetical protein [Thermoanaerobacter sp. YS13]KHO62682.1 hypothetical protein THYS13_07450 [Thermoanaerobacter sp. YS13]
MKRILILLIISSVLLFAACGSKTIEKEFTNPELDQELSQGGQLDYTTYKEITENGEKRLEVDIAFTSLNYNDVLRVGTVQAIMNLVEREFVPKYNNIKLTIMLENPKYTFVEYRYNNGKWERKH